MLQKVLAQDVENRCGTGRHWNHLKVDVGRGEGIILEEGVLDVLGFRETIHCTATRSLVVPFTETGMRGEESQIQGGQSR